MLCHLVCGCFVWGCLALLDMTLELGSTGPGYMDRLEIAELIIHLPDFIILLVCCISLPAFERGFWIQCRKPVGILGAFLYAGSSPWNRLKSLVGRGKTAAFIWQREG